MYRIVKNEGGVEQMKFLNRLERKFGKYAIPNLMHYILVLYTVGTVLDILLPGFYRSFLCLDYGKVAQGQVWRLVTFIMAPYSSSGGVLTVFFFLIEVYLYRMIGNALEQAWGTFRFNLYIFTGILGNAIAALVIYIVYKQTMGLSVAYVYGLTYIFQSMFMAFAFLYPDVQLLLAFVIPIKVKYLGYLYGGFFAFEIVRCFLGGAVVQGVAMLLAMGNFLLFFLWSWKVQRPTMAQRKRRREFRKQVRNVAFAPGEPRHRCAICGRTEQDNPNLEFRYCSKCEGNFEYCSDHLFSHTHVKR